jgi:Ca2+-binding RTX toxin-like protein
MAVGGAFNDLLISNDGMDHNSPTGGWFGGPWLFGGDGDDTLIGGAARDDLHGDAGSDELRGGLGFDVLIGGAGPDRFVFDVAPGAQNADVIGRFTNEADFISGTDKIVLDAEAHMNLGAEGNFAADDARFFAGAGASSGQDASDRVIYDTNSGELWYDADGSGAGAAQLIATIQGAPPLAATDIVAVGESAGGGEAMDGTAGDDTLAGGEGDDTLRGLAGRDSLNGGAGDDWLEGGTGQDSLTGGDGADSFVFREAPTNSNFDRLLDFASGTDTLRFDDAAYGNIGALGDFAAGDDRFFAGAGAKSGVDAEDRLVYDTSSGFLWYDADGSGSGGQLLVGVVQGAPALSAGDIAVI